MSLNSLGGIMTSEGTLDTESAAQGVRLVSNQPGALHTRWTPVMFGVACLIAETRRARAPPARQPPLDGNRCGPELGRNRGCLIVANRCKRGERGRFTKGDNRLAIKVQVRLSAAQRATYVAAGGADWFRTQLDAEAERQRHTPTAHQPFQLSPGMGGTFTTNWNHPGDKGGPSGY